MIDKQTDGKVPSVLFLRGELFLLLFTAEIHTDSIMTNILMILAVCWLLIYSLV